MDRIVRGGFAALLVAGCVAFAGEPVAIVTDTGYAGDDLACWLAINMDTYLLVADPNFGTAFKSDNGSITPAKWPPGYTGHRAGSEVEVYDARGSLVATTGRRYRIDWVSLPEPYDGSQPPIGEFPRPFGEVICAVHPV
jgi:hypothetical protein